MAAGITFWWFPDEEPEFISFLQGTGNVMAIPSTNVKSPEELTPRPMAEFIQQRNPSQVLLGLEQHMHERIFESYESPSKETWYSITVMSSCVIQYRRGKFRASNKLGQSNVSAVYSRLNDTKTAMVKKDLAFKKWAEKVFRWVRKATPEWHQYEGYRVTPRVKHALESGELEIVP